MNYDHALSTLAHVKKVDIREGKAHRGRTAHGSWVVQPPAGPIYELTPAKAHLDLDGELRQAHERFQRGLAQDRLSMLRYLAGSPDEHPLSDPSRVRREHEQLQEMQKQIQQRNEVRARAWTQALEAHEKAQAVAATLARTDLADGSAVATLLHERRQVEQRREAAWHDALVGSTVWSEPAQVHERTELPVLRMRV